MARREFKDAIYGHIARVGKAVASPQRLDLLDLLAQCPRTVDDLAQAASLSIANTSQHLRVLHAAMIVTRTKRGSFVEYRLVDDDSAQLFLQLRRFAEMRFAEIPRLVSEELD